MKGYTITGSNLESYCGSNANVWTLATNDFECTAVNIFKLEVSSEALDFSDIRLSQNTADSETITQVSPEYKPYMEEGCEVAFLSKSASSADRDRVISSMKNEMSDYEYYLFTDSGSFYLIAWGTSNATKTQFYTPQLELNADVQILTLWD